MPSPQLPVDISGSLLQLRLRQVASRIIPCQFAWAVEYCKRPIHIAMHAHSYLDVMMPCAVGRYLQFHPPKAHAIVVADNPLMLFAQYLRLASAYIGDECRAFCRRLHTELGIMPRHIDLLQVAVRTGHVGHARLGQFLRQPPLMCPESAF